MDDVVERLREAAAEVLPGTPVRFAFMFGSHARGEAGPRSDIDVGVYVDDDLDDTQRFDLSLSLAGDLEHAAGHGPVEALVVLNDAPLSLAGRIGRDGVVLYSADDALRVRWTSETARRFHDWDLHARPLARERLRKLARGRR